LFSEGSDEIELPVYDSEQTETYKNVEICTTDTVERKQIENVIFEFKNYFTDVPGRTGLVEVNIKVATDKPIKCKNYPVPMALRDQLDKEIDSMLKLGVIEPSAAPYASPLVMIKKPDGVS